VSQAPALFAQNKWRTEGGRDFLQLVSENGQVLSWIDSTGAMSVSGVPPSVINANYVSGAKFDARFFNDGSTTSGQNTLTSATLACNAADNGKLVIVVNDGTNVYPFGTGLVTQIGCNSATVAALSTTASQTTGGLTWAIGTDDTAAIVAAKNAAWASNQALALPCGVTIVSAPPFVFATGQTFGQNFSVQGCLGTSTTMFILHPQITSTIMTGGTIFYQIPASDIGYSPAGAAGTFEINNIRLTTLNGALPATSGGFIFFIAQTAGHIQMTGFGLAGGANSCTAFAAASGEASFDRMNIQNTTLNGCLFFNFQGQGTNVLSNSILAFSRTGVIQCNSTICDLENNYLIGNGQFTNASVFTNGAGSSIRVRGGTYTASAGLPLFDISSGANTLSLDSTFVQNSNAGTEGGAIKTAAGATVYMQKSIVNCTNAAAQPTCIGGLGNAGTIFDLGGNTINGFPVGIMLIADGHSVKGACTGVATPSATLGLYGTGPNVVATACTSALIGSGSVVSGSRTLQNLLVTSTAAGVNASSGVVTVLKNGGATAITCTIGVGTSCVDGTHTVAVADGDLISIQFTTQAAETLAGVKAIVEWN
jgi:hypothetical protein